MKDLTDISKILQYRERITTARTEDVFRIHEWELYNALKERNNEAAEVSFTCGEMKRILRGLYLLERDMQRCTRIHAEDWRGILSMNTRL